MTTTALHQIPNGPQYTIHPDHRNGTPNKSQWQVTPPEEVASFQNCFQNNWIDDSVGWGLHLQGGIVVYLGVGQDHQTLVFIAKFVADAQKALWHGYPADHSRRHDRPVRAILDTWLRTEVLPAAKIRKIGKGEPCKL